jgi:hypothetical protein
MLTSEISIVRLPAAPIAILPFSRPIRHSTQLVPLRKGGIWDTIQRVLRCGWGAPSVLRGKSGHNIRERDWCHDGNENTIIWLVFLPIQKEQCVS